MAVAQRDGYGSAGGRRGASELGKRKRIYEYAPAAVAAASN